MAGCPSTWPAGRQLSTATKAPADTGSSTGAIQHAPPPVRLPPETLRDWLQQPDTCAPACRTCAARHLACATARWKRHDLESRRRPPAPDPAPPAPANLRLHLLWRLLRRRRPPHLFWWTATTLAARRSRSTRTGRGAANRSPHLHRPAPARPRIDQTPGGDHHHPAPVRHAARPRAGEEGGFRLRTVGRGADRRARSRRQLQPRHRSRPRLHRHRRVPPSIYGLAPGAGVLRRPHRGLTATPSKHAGHFNQNRWPNIPTSAPWPTASTSATRSTASAPA